MQALTDLVVLCPTRGRPEAAAQALIAFDTTAATGISRLTFVIDEDDPSRSAYEDQFEPIIVPTEHGGNMVKALNYGAAMTIEHVDPKYLGFIGDDHRYRSYGWDSTFMKRLDDAGGGFVYGNDLFWKDGEIPTQIVMSASIVKALGWMGLPTCHHLFIDNVWRVIGEATSLSYMSNVIVEHLHPATGKVKADEGHLRVNAPEMYSHDQAAFEEWQADRAPWDIALAKAAL